MNFIVVFINFSQIIHFSAKRIPIRYQIFKKDTKNKPCIYCIEAVLSVFKMSRRIPLFQQYKNPFCRLHISGDINLKNIVTLNSVKN